MSKRRLFQRVCDDYKNDIKKCILICKVGQLLIKVSFFFLWITYMDNVYDEIDR